jgi:hypothetical protein
MKQLSYDARSFISDSGFWEKLLLLKEVLEPLDKAIRISESNKAHLGMVVDRWASILKHLKAMTIDFPVLNQFVLGQFLNRFKLHIHPIHQVAFYLDPQNIKASIDSSNESIIFDFFRKYTHTEDDAESLMMEFA